METATCAATQGQCRNARWPVPIAATESAWAGPRDFNCPALITLSCIPLDKDIARLIYVLINRARLLCLAGFLGVCRFWLCSPCQLCVNSAPVFAALLHDHMSINVHRFSEHFDGWVLINFDNSNGCSRVRQVRTCCASSNPRDDIPGRGCGFQSLFQSALKRFLLWPKILFLSYILDSEWHSASRNTFI